MPSGITWGQPGPDMIYNYNMAQATAGPLPLGSSNTDASGATSHLPGWTAWGSGSATIVADATWPGGNYVQFGFGTLGYGVALTTDQFPVLGGAQVTLETIQSYSVPLGSTLNVEYDALFYDADGSSIAGSTASMTKPGADSVGAGARIEITALVPVNARNARIEVKAWETVAHSASTSFSLGAVHVFPASSFQNVVYDLSIGGVLRPDGGINGTYTFPGSPTNNKAVYRGDLGEWWYYDGAHWLSTTQYRIGLNTEGAMPLSASDTMIATVDTSVANWWIEAAEFWTLVVGTNNGTNYWAFTLDTTNTFNTSADTAGTWTKHVVTVNAVYATGTLPAYTTITKTLTPGTLTVACTYVLRKIAT